MRIRELGHAFRVAQAAVDNADKALGLAIYEAVQGGHLSEQAAARSAGIPRSAAHRYKIGEGDRRAGRRREDTWRAFRDI